MACGPSWLINKWVDLKINVVSSLTSWVSLLGAFEPLKTSDFWFVLCRHHTAKNIKRWIEARHLLSESTLSWQVTRQKMFDSHMLLCESEFEPKVIFEGWFGQTESWRCHEGFMMARETFDLIQTTWNCPDCYSQEWTFKMEKVFISIFWCAKMEINLPVECWLEHLGFRLSTLYGRCDASRP